MHHQSSLRTLFVAMLTALSVFSVFAGDIPFNRDTTVTGRLKIKSESLFIDLGPSGVALVEAESDEAEARLRKQVGKTVTLHGQLHNKMIRGTSDMKLVFELD